MILASYRHRGARSRGDTRDRDWPDRSWPSVLCVTEGRGGRPSVDVFYGMGSGRGIRT